MAGEPSIKTLFHVKSTNILADIMIVEVLHICGLALQGSKLDPLTLKANICHIWMVDQNKKLVEFVFQHK